MSFIRTRTGAAVLTGCLFVFGALIFFGRSKPESGLVRHSRSTSVGIVTTVIGHADFRLPQTMDFKELQSDSQIVSGEMIVAHEASQVLINFEGGASIRLQPGARLVAERDSSFQNAVMATLLEGEADIVSPGDHRGFRLFKNGRDLTDSNSAVAPAAVIVSGSGARTFTKPDLETLVTASTPAEAPTPVPVARVSDETGTMASADSLSNEEIRKSLRSAGGFFQRCYLTYLNRLKIPPARAATITVGFVISNSGKVRDAKIVRTEFNDEVLNKCILETVERTPFRAFKAADIPVLEFPIELH